TVILNPNNPEEAPMVREGIERRLAAILSADVAGYSRLMSGDEAGTLAALKAHRAELINPTVAGFGGRIVKLMGDGALVEFPSVVDAVECAVAIQKGMAERNAEVPEDHRIAFRIGINLGDIIIEGDDIYGDGVNVAARMEGLAEPGGICMSRTVVNHVKGKVELDFEDMGEQVVKTIPEPVSVYRVRLADAGQEIETTTPETHSLPDKPSIAVLPFDNMSGDPEQEYFSDGITEDIITELSRFHSLFVIARSSSFTYKGHAIDVQRIAAQLGVRYILEGSVRKAGGRIRVTAQLIDAPTRNHVWAERYDRELEDIFELQDEITRTIVASIEPELGGVERDRAHRTPPDNLDAWGLYQRGLWHVYRFTAKDNAEARALLERATVADPNFAPAFAGLSFTYFANAFLGYDRDRDRYRDMALEAARRSVALDDRDEAARVALGRAYLIRSEHDRAIAEFETVIELNPNYAQAHYNLGWALMLAGRHEEALPCLGKAEQLSPHDPRLFAFCIMRSQALYHIGDFDRALEEARRSSRQSNAHANSRALLVAILGRLGHVEEARSELALLLAERPDYTRHEFVASFPYRRPEDMSRVLEGLAAAGMRG
ncbi:MAG: tetratricopeptide repeat protein, partial [Hyphomicrobium sp.]